MKEKYNVDVELVSIGRWTEVDDINNLLATGNAPDVCVTYSYPTIQTFAGMGGVVDLAPYLEQYKEYLPDLWKLLGDYNIYYDQDPATGSVWAVEAVLAESSRLNTFIRKDWLDKLGLAQPTTEAELHSCLVAFRDNAELLLGADADKMVPFAISTDIGWRADLLSISKVPEDVDDATLYVYGYDDRHLLYFGMADTAGFPKEAYYRFQSAWTKAPMVHIGVSWDWNMGQQIDIPVMTNAYAVSLYVNDFLLGTKLVDQSDPAASLPVWHAVFVSGKLRAVAYDARHRVIAENVRYTPGETAGLRLSCEEALLRADGEDLAFVTIQAVDEQGHPVDNAGNNVQVLVTGGGRLMGLDNGDSTSADAYQTTVRHLFSGKLLAIIGSNGLREDVHICVRSKGLPDTEMTLPVCASSVRPGSSCLQQLCLPQALPEDMPVRRIDIIPAGSTSLTPEQPESTLYTSLLPSWADRQPIAWRAVTAAGIKSPCVQLRASGNKAVIRGVGDGTVYIRAAVNNGASHIRVVSHLEVSLSGFGHLNLDPYSFISAGMYSGKRGEVTAGNEQGVAFARDGESEVWFDQVDFGPAGSDRVTLPIFALDDRLHEIFMYAGEQMIAVLPCQKPCSWNEYQPETYTLPMALTGIQTIRFRLHEKLHLKGFQFERQSRAWRYLTASQADSMYGDSFTRSDTAILDIGNNVTLTFDGLDFGTQKQVWLHLDGATPLTTTPITLTLRDAQGCASTNQLMFDKQSRGSCAYPLMIPGGVLSASFVFLPGCRFDFYGLRFSNSANSAALFSGLMK